MKQRIHLALALIAVLGFTALLRAADDKPVTLKGTLGCAKCMSKEGATCQNVLVVKQGDKSEMYYIAATDTVKDVHGKICKASKDNVTVTGTVAEKDGKKWITVSKIEGLDDKG